MYKMYMYKTFILKNNTENFSRCNKIIYCFNLNILLSGKLQHFNCSIKMIRITIWIYAVIR